MRYLSQEVSFRRHHHHQLAHQPRESGHPPVLCQQLQGPSSAYAEARPGPRPGGNQRYRQVHSLEDS
ncbi:hypothetical protein F5Y18DRAFT_408212 [Xylariaceae sp. FL1019]|nr:hypothetical protein F5Y18DRAFT_408212 [Xylariaceae sp. FL1019]